MNIGVEWGFVARPLEKISIEDGVSAVSQQKEGTKRCWAKSGSGNWNGEGNACEQQWCLQRSRRKARVFGKDWGGRELVLDVWQVMWEKPVQGYVDQCKNVCLSLRNMGSHWKFKNVNQCFWKDYSGCFIELRLTEEERMKIGRRVRSLLQAVEAKVVERKIWILFESCQWVWGVTEERGEDLGILQLMQLKWKRQAGADNEGGSWVWF